MKLEDLDRRTVAALNRAEITSLSQLQAMSLKDLGMLPGIGKRSLQAIRRLIDGAEVDFVIDQIDSALNSIRASRSSLDWVKPADVFETIQRAQETCLRSADLVEDSKRRRLALAGARAQGKTTV